MPENQWSIRIQAARDAQARSRYAFLASIVISVALLIVVFNYEFSWLRNFALGNHPEPPPGTVQEELLKERRKAWVQSTGLDISLLGVNVSESDLSLLGSFSLYVLTIWFFYCMRRENHLIGSLLIDADRNNDKQISLTVYHGVASYTVFTTIGGDEPIKTVRPPPPRHTSPNRIRLINIGLLFLPAITISAMIASDILSLFESSPMRKLDKPLWALLSFQECLHVAIVDGLAILIFAFTITKCTEIL